MCIIKNKSHDSVAQIISLITISWVGEKQLQIVPNRFCIYYIMLLFYSKKKKKNAVRATKVGIIQAQLKLPFQHKLMGQPTKTSRLGLFLVYICQLTSTKKVLNIVQSGHISRPCSIWQKSMPHLAHSNISNQTYGPAN